MIFPLTESIINNSINDALAEAERAGIKGKEVTPFILAAISKITAGKSLQTSTFSFRVSLDILHDSTISTRLVSHERSFSFATNRY